MKATRIKNETIKNQGFQASFFPYVILVLLLFITCAITYVFYNSAKSKDTLRFANQTARLHYSIENKLRLYITILKGGRGFVEATPQLDKNSFARFAESLDFANEYRGVQGIGYSEYVTAGNLENVRRKMIGEGVENFRIFPQSERDFYQPVLYLEPVNDKTKIAVGFDMASDPARFEALERARDTGDIAMTGKLVPVQENPAGKIYGFLIYLPIYRSEIIPATVEERRKNIRGYVYCPFRANNFISEIYHDENRNDIAIKIYDTKSSPENLLTETDLTANGTGKNLEFSEGVQIIRDELDFGGRKWIVEYTTLPEFSEQSSIIWTPLILICGLTFSFVLFGMSYWEAAASEKVKKTAAQLWETQKQRDILFLEEQKARKNAEEANSSKDEFIAIVSHELKTPLNAIGGWMRILNSQKITENTREMAIQKISKNLRLQTAMVEQLLNYSEVVSDKFVLNGVPVNFTKIFLEACSEIEPLFDEKNITFEKDIQTGVCLIEGDEEKLKMVVYHLFSNSLKFTSNGGKIAVALSSDGEFVKLVLKDSGRGIIEEFLPLVFERYKQAEKPNTRNYGGLGLGMTITKNIVKLHKGEILAESAGKDQGSTFTVKFPCISSQNV